MSIQRCDLGLKAFLMLITSGCIVGLGPVIAKSITAPAIAIVLYRIAIPIPVLYLLNKNRVCHVKSSCDKVLMALIGIFFALDLVAFYISLKYTTVTSATLLSNLSPLFLASYALIRKKRLSKEALWLLTSIAGLVLLCGTKNIYTGDELIGYLAALSAAVFFSGYILLINRVGKDCSSSDIMLWSSIGGAIFLLIICLVFNVNILIRNLDSIFYIMLLSLIVQLIGQTMLTKAISAFPPAFSSLGILIDPVSAAFFSWVILHESLSLLEILGAFLILVGIFGSYQFQKNTNNEAKSEDISYAKS